MIGLDTNVLVRYIVQDEPAQAARAEALIEAQCSADSPARVDAIVLCELVWVLESAYGCSRKVVAEVLRTILGSAELAVETPQLAWAALRAYEKGQADFADYFIGARNREAGCVATYSFDKRAAESPWHEPIA